MAYMLNKFNGAQLVVLQDGSLDTSTSVGLVGRNYVGYGEIQNENFLHLLENFANDSAPSRPIPGQIWFHTVENTAYIYDGNQWGVIGAAQLSATAPLLAVTGSLWLKTPSNQLFVYTGVNWQLIGPDSVEGFASTKVRSATLIDTNDAARPVLIIETNAVPLAICTSESFVISTQSAVAGFSSTLVAGINLSNSSVLQGSVTGNAATATQLGTARLINGVPFNATQNITIQSATPNKLSAGTYLQGADFDGSVARSWSVDASSSNSIGKVVVRNSQGGFAAGNITADFTGNLTGNVTATAGTSTFDVIQANQFIGASLSGNAASASRLAIARTINAVAFDGSSNITITAAANTLSGTALSTSITHSSLTQLGIVSALNVAVDINIGSSAQLQLLVDSGTPTIRSSAGSLNFDMGTSGPDISFITAATSLGLSGPNAPAILGDNTTNLGIVGYKFNNVFANIFHGLSTSAQYADLAENYAADANYEPGTVLEFGGVSEVTEAAEATVKVAGIVSTNPAHVMNSALVADHIATLSLQGRVPCKVRGPIRKGAMLVSAGNGYAKAVETAAMGSVIGKALEDFDQLQGIIEVVVGRM